MRARDRNQRAGGSKLAVPMSIAAMEARPAEALPTGNGWQFEPKWDGFRCLAFRAGRDIELHGRSKVLTRFFPEMVEKLQALPAGAFALDGELTVPVGDQLSFDALQQRLHPAASRIKKLAAETPANLILFDCLQSLEGDSLLDAPMLVRRAELERWFAHFGDIPGLHLSPATHSRDEAELWLAQAGGAIDGVVAKHLDGVYVPGERTMIKVKRLRTADVVVGGFRYERMRQVVSSLLLGLYDAQGRLDHVGFTAALPADYRAQLTPYLESLVEPPGFTGKAPGGPSRWSDERSEQWHPLRPVLVAEVRYDHATQNRFRHGTTLLRWREDKDPRDCTFDQLREEASAAELVHDLTGS